MQHKSITNSTMDAALDKLRDEMAGNATEAGIRQVGEYMTDRLINAPEISRAVLAEGKTIKGAFHAIYEYAQKNKTGNYAYVPPETAYELVASYYGISAEEAKSNPQAIADLRGSRAVQDDELDLDTLLGW